jgi:hypothetical protein
VANQFFTGNDLKFARELLEFVKTQSEEYGYEVGVSIKLHDQNGELLGVIDIAEGSGDYVLIVGEYQDVQES